MDDLLRQLIQNVVDSTYNTGGVPITDIDKLADYLTANPPKVRCTECTECGEVLGRLHTPTCAKRAIDANYVLHVDCEVCDE